MRLIDADALFRKVKTECNPYGKPTIGFEDGKRVMNWIEQAPTISGWTSVKDRMPDEDGSTLICTKNGRVCTARFYKHQGGWNAYAGRNAAYWMPLPTPPEEVSDGNVH